MTRFSRRDLMKAGAFVLAAPAVLRAHDALATSGSLNVYAWGDYFDKNTLLADFTNSTGVKVNLSTYGSNEECENKLRAAGGKGFDIIFPSVDTGPNYYKDNLLQPIDEAKFKSALIIPSIYRNSLTLGAAYRGKRYLVPFDWGTEGVTWDLDQVPRQEVRRDFLWRHVARRSPQADRHPPEVGVQRRRALSRRHRRA
ncbi:extracellular solute-binding protein [Ancylobacter dichloromethanicus]